MLNFSIFKDHQKEIENCLKDISKYILTKY